MGSWLVGLWVYGFRFRAYGFMGSRFMGLWVQGLGFMGSRFKVYGFMGLRFRV